MLILSSGEAQAPRGRGAEAFVAAAFAGESGFVRNRFEGGCSIGGVLSRSLRFDVDELGSLLLLPGVAVVSLSCVVSTAVVSGSKDSSAAAASLMSPRSSHSL